jgi:PAS domain S-box-containing protein
MPANRPIRVLHLEDSDLDADLVRGRLELAGLPVAIDRVVDRARFVELLGAASYDVILSDYQVPSFEGLAALELARAARPRTPFLFVTGVMGEELAVEALKRGATDYILKDRLIRLPAAVERALAESRERDGRRAAEDRARRASDRAAAILESITEAFLLVSPEGRVASVNAAFERLFGTPRDAVLGRDLWEVFPEARGTPVEREVRRAIDRRAPVEFEHHFAPPGRWFLARAYPDAEGGLSVFLDDVTDRKRAEAELADRELRYRLVADASHDVIWDWNLATNQVVWNEGLATRFGYDDGRVAPDASWWIDRIHPDDAARVARSIHEHIDGGSGAWQGEYRFRRADGTYAHVLDRGRVVRDPDGRAVRMVGSMLDLTERRRAEAALRDAEERFAFVRRSSGVGFWYCDLPFDALLWDDLVKAHFHLPPDAQVTIDVFYGRIHPEDRAAVDAAIARSIDRRAPYDVEYRTVDPAGGAERWVRAIGRTFYDPDGTPRRFDGVTIDVTPQRRAAAERERLLEAAQQARDDAEAANRMKDEFLATLSHELRTPLNAIVGWTQILRTTRVGDADREEGLEVIDRNARAQAQLIEDLLDISRIVSGKLTLDVQRVRLQEVIEAAIAAVLPAAQAKGVRVQPVLDSLAGPVTGDPNRLQQVVWNLLTNAVKFTPRGGTVQVLLERVNSHLEVSVVDSGQGIAPEFLPHVFDRFRQADGSTTRRHGGLGLGLSIVKHLVEMHGGSVRAKSPGEGQGSTFVVALPIAVVHPETPSKVRPKDAAGEATDDDCAGTDLEGLRVLVVDDEADARTLMGRVLRHCGATVEAAGSVPEALRLVASFRPDVIVSDVGMPDQDGYDFIRQVRKTYSAKAIPAAALTAFARAEDRMRAMRAGFQVHLAKPVNPDELVAVVATLAARTGSGGDDPSPPQGGATP